MKYMLKIPRVKKYGLMAILLLGSSRLLGMADGEIMNTLFILTTLIGAAYLLAFICTATLEWILRKKEQEHEWPDKYR